MALELPGSLLIGFQTVMGPLELLYYAGYRIKQSQGLRNRKRLPHRVMSVGNITVGGTGKTPAVIAIAEEAKKRGYRPCVLTRGYRGKAKGPCFISKGEGALLDVDAAGDEAFLMAERLKGVPVVKGNDRYEAGMFALRELASQPSALGLQPFLFILDDGFQHWRLYRDEDILLIDGANPFGNRRLLPTGILREPPAEMGRADVIVLTKAARGPAGADNRAGLVAEIRRHNPLAPVYFSEHRPVFLRTSPGRELPLDLISGKPVFAFCGIANPDSFRETLLRINAHVRDVMVFGDHHTYRKQDLRQIHGAARRSGADWIVTTEKDIIKLKDFDLDENLLSLRIEFNIGEEFYERIFSASP